MVQSALLGDPPATDRDALIRKAMKASAGNYFNPVKDLPWGPPRPTPDLAWEDDAWKVQACYIVCLILVAGFTIGRFWTRAKIKAWGFGIDDLLVGSSASHRMQRFDMSKPESSVRTYRNSETLTDKR